MFPVACLAFSSGPRTVINLDSGWERGIGHMPEIRRDQPASFGPWQSATLPDSVWIRPLDDKRIWQGFACYRRALAIPKRDLGKHLELIIDGAMQTSRLFLNGRQIGERLGGYLPLIADVTGIAKAHNDIEVIVDNEDAPLVPPGKPQKDLDFMYGSGLYRHTWLEVTSKLYIPDALAEDARFGGGLSVTESNVSEAHADVHLSTFVRNSLGKDAAFTIRQTLVDENGTLVGRTALNVKQTMERRHQASFEGPKVHQSGSMAAALQTSLRSDSAKEPKARQSGSMAPALQTSLHSDPATELQRSTGHRFSQILEVQHPKLWSPDSPNLYTLKTELLVHHRIVDSVTTTIGIRSIEVSRDRGFVLNGKPLRLVGTNRHSDYPWVGPALSDAANERDALLIKKSGHNIVRLSHYPQAPAFMDACDRLGILTIPCIPGWQYWNKDPVFAQRVRQDIKELIRRDRNHPSVAFWETGLNETYPPEEIAQDWYKTAKSESIDGKLLVSGDALPGRPWDIAYNTWKEDLSRPQDAMPDKPGYIREYGDYEFGGATSSSRVRIRDGMDKLLQETWNHVWSYNKFRPQYPWTMGAGTWEMFDHNVPWDFAVSASGLADIFRREKSSFWFYESQSDRNPFLKIAADWQPGSKTRTVVVFTNQSPVLLYLNGKLLATQAAAPGGSTEYGACKPWDGSNTDHLAHPPIVFRDVSWEAGTLTAKSGGLIDSIRTAGEPARLKVWLGDLGVSPTANDLVFVRAAVVDANGNVCTHDSRRISFSCKGAQLAGESNVPCEMGVASVLVRTGFKRSRVLIRAHDGSIEGRASF